MKIPTFAQVSSIVAFVVSISAVVKIGDDVIEANAETVALAIAEANYKIAQDHLTDIKFRRWSLVNRISFIKGSGDPVPEWMTEQVNGYNELIAKMEAKWEN